MHEAIDSRIEAVQTSGYKVCLVVSGGGSGAVAALLSHPGASRFIFEAQMPYSPEAMFDYLGEKLEQACSSDAAVTMAHRAFERALVFSMTSGCKLPILGIACTAALQTTRERKGDDRAFVCIKSRKEDVIREIPLPAGDRAEQEQELSRGIIDVIADYVGVA